MSNRPEERYALTSSNKYIIDVSVNSPDDVYADVWKQASFIKEELDPRLIDYLITSVHELKSNKFVIQFDFAKDADVSMMSHIKESVRNTFRYRQRQESKQYRTRLIRSGILLLFGFAMLAAVAMLHKAGFEESSATAFLFYEGLMLAGWVLLFGTSAIALAHWVIHRRSQSDFQRLAEAPVLFAEESQKREDLAGITPAIGNHENWQNNNPVSYH